MGFLSLLVLLYLFVCLRSILPATVLDKDLRLERANIPEGSNAFDVLQVASSHFWWPDDAEREKYDAQKNSDFPMAGLSDWGKKTDHISAYLLSTTNWDDQLANTVLNNNRETLAAWDEAVGLPDLQVPEIFTVADLMSYLPNWKRLAQLAEVRENYLMHNGQEKAAFDQMVNQVMLGRKMQNSHSILIGYLVGTAVNSMGLNQIQRWAGKTQLTPRQLENYIRQLEQDPDESAAAYANTIKAEYQCQIGTLDAMRQGKLVDPDKALVASLQSQPDARIVCQCVTHAGQIRSAPLQRCKIAGLLKSAKSGGIDFQWESRWSSYVLYDHASRHPVAGTESEMRRSIAGHPHHSRLARLSTDARKSPAGLECARA